MTPVSDELGAAVAVVTLVKLGELQVPRFNLDNVGNNNGFSVKGSY